MATAPSQDPARTVLRPSVAPGRPCAAGREPSTAAGRRLRTCALAAAIAAVVLTGCTATGPAAPGAVAVDSGAAGAAPPPRRELDARVLYKLLVGELASHRGDVPLSLEHYLDVARETRDAGVAARAAKLAVFARDEGKGSLLPPLPPLSHQRGCY